MRKRTSQKQQQQRSMAPAARAHGESSGSALRPNGSNKSATHGTTSSSSNSRAFAFVRADAALAALVLAVYARTLYPSVAGGDSGELVAESCHLGISHPPGYPLFNLAVHAFATRLPWASATSDPRATPTIAWRANLFSAAATVLIYHCVRQWTSRGDGRSLPALTAAALFAFSPLVWTYAVGAEVFALNNLFAAALLFVLLHYARSLQSAGAPSSLRLATLGAFVSGLALCNQHTIVLFEVPVVLWVLFTRRRTLVGAELLQLTSAFLAGLLPYAYMPLAMTTNPQPGSWGDVTTLAGFVHHVRRGDYGTFRLFSTHETHEGLWTRLWLYAVDLSTREIPCHVALPVLAVGVVSTLQPHQPNGAAVGWLLLVAYAFYLLVFHSLANLPLSEGLTYGVHMRFWQQPNVIAFVWLGVGLDRIVAFVTQVTGSSSAPSVGRSLRSAAASAALFALVGYQLATWFALCDQSHAFYIRDYARALLDPLPRDALLIVNFDLQWTSLRYLQRCEQRRADVTVLNLSMMSFHWFAAKHAHYPALAFPGARLVPFGGASDGFTFARFLDANYAPLPTKATDGARERRRIFFGGKLNSQDADFERAYTFTPFGLLDEIHRLDEAAGAPQLRLQQWYGAQQRVLAVVRDRLPALPPGDLYNDETWEWTIARDHGMKSLSWSTFLLERTVAEDPHNLTLLSATARAMEHSVQFEPPQFWNAAATLKNLGLAYAQIVKSRHEFAAGGADPYLNAVVGAGVGDSSRLKERASARMLEVWDQWLQIPAARRDPGFAAIERVVRQFLPTPTESQVTRSAAASRKKRKAKRKARSSSSSSS